ncbi:MAG: TetR family transcriptional regulator C-terminal domain-containing protein [Solirubrobacteraceae bacterium]|nr:TetR family transcriptional regulator C-terminal domain-containing protein [Solirubrobacteraceae bacterium]
MTTAEPDTPRRRIGRPPTLDREGALVAARAVIAERGIDRTRYADVAAVAGVPVTTLQHAFGSLQSMLIESVAGAARGEIVVLRGLSRDAGVSSWQRIRDFIAGAVESPEDADSWRVWLEFWRVASRDPEMGSLAGEIYEQWWAYLDEIIAAGHARGEFTSTLAERTRDASIAVVAIIDGVAAALVLRADGPDHARTRQIATDAAAAILGVAPGSNG